MTAITPDGGSKRAVVIGLLQNLTKGGSKQFLTWERSSLKGNVVAEKLHNGRSQKTKEERYDRARSKN
jgi:hypothetical protein